MPVCGAAMDKRRSVYRARPIDVAATHLLMARMRTRRTCRDCSIRSKALCQALPDSVLAQINRVSWRRPVAAGRSVFGPEETSRLVANIIHGVVKLSTSLPDGRTQIVGLQFPADFVGRPFAKPGPLLAEAATDVELCCFDRRHFEAVLREHKGLEELFVTRILEDLDEARSWMLLLGRKTAEERVASLVLLCAQRTTEAECTVSSSGPNLRITLPLSRTEIGEFLGLTLETVGRMLKRLDRDGIIAIEAGRGVRIRDFDRLRQRAEQSRP